MKIKIGIEIKNIKVDDGYYSFDYVVNITGDYSGEVIKDRYEGDYCTGVWGKAKDWKDMLENGEALKNVLETITQEI